MKEITMQIDFDDEQPIVPKEVTQKRKKHYAFDEVLKHSIKYFSGDELAAKVWINKYALKDSQGKIFELSPDDMHKRMAKEIARIEQNYPNSESEEDIYYVLKDFKYIVPQGGSMSGLGNNHQIVSLSNCKLVTNSTTL